MTAKLTIAFSAEVLSALQRNKAITISLAAGGGAASRGGPATPRAGSLPARVIEWAQKRAKPFRNTDIEKRFNLSRAHASMVTSKLAASGHPIRRKSRGVYVYVG
jgi:hypothetical protein